jgi:hypothetical protein
MKPHFRFDFTFPRNYQAKLLECAPPVHPVEKLHHFPVQMEEGDREGAYVRVVPARGPAWTGFFALGFDSPQVLNAVFSCPDPDCLCVVAGGYAYLVKATDPAQWLQIEQRPVMEMSSVPQMNLLIVIGFTSITAVGSAGIQWTTARLSWDGVRLTRVGDSMVEGLGWDAVTDREVAFTVDLKTGKHIGGARPGL